MSEERKSLVWPWVVALLVVPPILYVVSFGPACWIARIGFLPTRAVIIAYRPIVENAHEWPCGIGEAFYSYSGSGQHNDTMLTDLTAIMSADLFLESTALPPQKVS
jgi:hypothetical protein